MSEKVFSREQYEQLRSLAEWRPGRTGSAAGRPLILGVTPGHQEAGGRQRSGCIGQADDERLAD